MPKIFIRGVILTVSILLVLTSCTKNTMFLNPTPQVFCNENVHSYAKFNDGFDLAMAYILKNDIKNFPAGRYDIDKDNVFMIISESNMRSEQDALLESHRQYIDVQWVLIGGPEKHGIKNTSECLSIKIPYDADKDIAFFNDKSTSYIEIKEGEFVVYDPNTAHAPLIGSGKIKKCVIKIKIK